MKNFILVLFLILSNISFGQVTYYGGKPAEKFDYFLYYLENFYVEETNEDSLTDLAIKHALSALDRFSTYQTVEESQAQLNADKGFNPKGSGLDFYIFNKNKYLINYIAPGGPAEKLGIEIHDELLSINNVNLASISKDSVYGYLKGQLDKLVVTFKKHSGAIKTVELNKSLLPFSSIVSSYMINDRVGYIKMMRFTVNTENEFIENVKALKSKGLQSLIIDLRGNPGGVKTSAIKFTDHFIKDEKLISYSQGGHFPKEENLGEIAGLFESGKLIVLTDNVTASASELFSVAIQDWDRGIIMGEETFGKGLIQQSYKLNDGSTVRLTIAKYYSPTGRQIQKDEYKDWISTVESKIPPNGLTAQSVFEKDRFSFTNSGRKILIGKGGVIPDIYIKKDILSELNDWYYFKNGYVYDFAVQYSYIQRNILLNRYANASILKGDKALSNQIDIEFRNYLVGKQFNDANSRNFIIPSMVIVKIKAWISSMLWNNASYHEVNNINDSLIDRAVKVLADEDLYREVLNKN